MRPLLLLFCSCIPAVAQSPWFTGSRQPQQQQQPQQQPPGSLSGSVVDAATGEPVTGAMVMLHHYSQGGMSSSSVDRAGQFSITNLQPGQYYVQASHQSYPGPIGLPQTGILVDVESGKAATGIVVKLIPAGTVSGLILGDDGEPLANCGASLLATPLGSTPPRQSGYGLSNDEGEFRIEPVAPDRYLLAVRCSEALPVERLLALVGPEGLDPGAAWQPVYYPDSPTIAGASIISVAPGANIEVELHLKPAPVTTVSGVVTAPAGAAVADMFNVLLLPEDNATAPDDRLNTSADGKSGRFRFIMVPPGAYRLVARPFNRGRQSSWFATQHITVGQTPPPPVTLQMQPTITLAGKVEDPPVEAPNNAQPAVRMTAGPLGLSRPGGQPAKGSLALSEADPSRYSESHGAQVNAEDGTFVIEGLSPGRWRVQYHSFRQQEWIESMQYGDTPTQDQIIEIAQGSTVPLQIKMGGKAPEIHYELKGAPAQSKSYWMLQATPANGPATMGMNTIGAVSPGQPIQARPLASGRYQFFAVELTLGGGMINERVSELIRREVKPVEITAGREQTVGIQCFTQDEVRKLLAAFLAGEAR